MPLQQRDEALIRAAFLPHRVIQATRHRAGPRFRKLSIFFAGSPDADLYVGVSNYPADLTAQAAQILRSLGTPLLIHQPKYSMFERWVEEKLIDVLRAEGVGGIAFSPLAQGLLTNRYLGGVPDDSRAGKTGTFLRREQVTDQVLARVNALNTIAQQRGQTLAQMALAWVLRHPEITSALIGASKVSQIDDAVHALDAGAFSDDELRAIEAALAR